MSKEKFKKSIVQSGNTLKTVSYPELHKHNQKKQITGICNFCYEDVVFRVVLINRVNALACTMCLKNARLYKTVPLRENRMFYNKEALTLKNFFIPFKARRLWNRTKTYFKGNLVFLPFKIRRKSKLGLRITNTIIKIKGFRNA